MDISSISHDETFASFLTEFAGDDATTAAALRPRKTRKTQSMTTCVFNDDDGCQTNRAKSCHSCPVLDMGNHDVSKIRKVSDVASARNRVQQKGDDCLEKRQKGHANLPHRIKKGRDASSDPPQRIKKDPSNLKHEAPEQSSQSFPAVASTSSADAGASTSSAAIATSSSATAAAAAAAATSAATHSSAAAAAAASFGTAASGSSTKTILVRSFDTSGENPTLRNSMEGKNDSSAVVEGNEDAGASSSPRSLSLSYSCVRKITNTTYLRRIHLSKEDAIGLFPEMQGSMKFTFSRRHRDTSAPFKAGSSFIIQDGEGRQWPILLEFVRTAGQRHTRISKGWAELCSANGFEVDHRIRFARWARQTSSSSSSSGEDALVTVSLLA